jgi:hypothetical protein
VLIRSGVSTTWVAGLAVAAPSVGADAFISNPVAWQDVASPQQLQPASLFLYGLAYAIEDGPPDELIADHRLSIRKQVLLRTDSTPKTQSVLHLLRDRSLGRNSLESFLIWRPAVGTLLDEQLASIVRPEKLKASVLHALDALDENPLEFHAWSDLASIIGPHEPDADVRERIRSAIKQSSLEIQDLTSCDLYGLLVTLLFQCTQNTIAHTRADKFDLRPRVILVAQLLAERWRKHPTNSDVEVLGSLLFECIRLVALVHDDPKESARLFGQLLHEVVDTCPMVASTARRLVQSLSDMLPITQSKQLWRVLTYLRTFR